jgi:macrolide-specific efflux system membrane fusion protein
MRWKVPAAIVLVAVGVGAVVYAVIGGPGASRASSTQYLTATAATADIADTVDATGSLARATTYDLNFGLAPTVEDASGSGGGGSGTWSVREVKVAVGDVVEKGAVLAIADTTSLRRDLAAAKASQSAARTQRTMAKTTLDGASGTDAIRQARIGYQNAIAQYTQAQGQVADLTEQIARATITAPADGTVVTVNVVAGADSATGPAISLATGPLQAIADFTETDLPSLKTGQAASVTVDAIDATIDGLVSAIAPSAASTSGSVVTYAVTIQLTSPPASARPGMSAKASVTIAQASGVLAVPAVALNGSALTGYSVLVVGSDGSTESRTVTVGLVTSTQAEIQSGLQAGESVVIGTTAAQTTTTGGGGFGIPGAGGVFRTGGGTGTGGNRNGNGGNGGGGGGTQP